MATVYKRDDRTTGKLWVAIVTRKGMPRLKQSFFSKDDAQLWARSQEQAISVTGLPLTHENLKKVTVGEIIQRYLDEVTPTKASQVNERAVLNKFLRERKALCGKALAYVSKTDAYEYRDKRLKETWRDKPITARTVAREIVILRRAFNVAKEEWGYANLVNPFAAMKLKGTKFRRKRRLNDGELEKLQEASKKCLGLNRLYVPLAIWLAIDTGMRLDEIFNLRWRDIDFTHREIEIQKSKTDHATGQSGRTIVLPAMAIVLLRRLHTVLMPKPKATELIFPNTKEGRPYKDAFKQSWADLVKRAEIEGLQFRDLRREAGSRFDEAGLTQRENELMLGHEGEETNAIYVRSKLKIIRDKLDRYALGTTFEEYERAKEAENDTEVNVFQEQEWFMVKTILEQGQLDSESEKRG